MQLNDITHFFIENWEDIPSHYRDDIFRIKKITLVENIALNDPPFEKRLGYQDGDLIARPDSRVEMFARRRNYKEDNPVDFITGVVYETIQQDGMDLTARQYIGTSYYRKQFIMPFGKIENIRELSNLDLGQPTLKIRRPYPEHIVATAIVLENNQCFFAARPARHSDLIFAIHELFPKTKINNEKYRQGFLTSMRRYVSREKALEIAREQNQLIGPPRSVLFSEELW